MSFVSHLECTRCENQFQPGQVHNLCACGSPLSVRYDLRGVAKVFSPEKLTSRPRNLWRYREVLPVARDSSILCLGEGFTPLIHAHRLGEKIGLPNLHLKDESLNPTGSFKARSAEQAEEWPDPCTVASGLRVPVALGDFLILLALRESRGGTLAVSDEAMLGAVAELAATEGVLTSPEGGATLAALRRLLADGFLSGYETIVLFLTASGYKYAEALQTQAFSWEG